MIWGREAGRGQGPAGGDGSADTPDVSEDEPGEGEEGEQADGGAQGVAERERLGGGGSILGEPEDADDEEGRAHDKGPHGDVRLAAELVLVVGLPLAACSASVRAGGVGSRQGDQFENGTDISVAEGVVEAEFDGDHDKYDEERRAERQGR